MVETNDVVARIIRVSRFKHANMIIVHLRKWALLAMESMSWGDSRAPSETGHKRNKQDTLSKEFCLFRVGVVAWLWSILRSLENKVHHDIPVAAYYRPCQRQVMGMHRFEPLPTLLVYISSHSRVTSLPVGRKSILTPPLHILYIFWHLHNTKTWLPFPIPCSILSVDPFWEVQGIIYLQLYDPAILGFLAGQYPLVSCIIGSFQTIDLS